MILYARVYGVIHEIIGPYQYDYDTMSIECSYRPYGDKRKWARGLFYLTEDTIRLRPEELNV